MTSWNCLQSEFGVVELLGDELVQTASNAKHRPVRPRPQGAADLVIPDVGLQILVACISQAQCQKNPPEILDKGVSGKRV